MNKMSCKFKSRAENEAFARTIALSFLMPLNAAAEEMMEIRTLVSEGVTNAIIHGYEGNREKMVKLEIGYDDHGLITIIITDKGKGISDIDQALEPLYTSKKSSERSGMGMTIMQTFSDSFDIISAENEGRTIVIQKQLHVNLSAAE